MVFPERSALPEVLTRSCIAPIQFAGSPKRGGGDMLEKPTEIGIEFVDPDSTIKCIAFYILCGLINFAALPPE